MVTSCQNGGQEQIGSRYREERLLSSKMKTIQRRDKNHPSSTCNHFSIRGYVEEIHRLNRKLCWPFIVYDDEDKLEEGTEKLPPLSVPQFRWWCCRKCLGLGNNCLADPKEKLAESSSCKIKACGMHIELGGETGSLDGANSSKNTNRENSFRLLLPSGETSATKDIELFPVPSAGRDLTAEHVRLSDDHVNANVLNPTGMGDENLACVLGVSTCLRRDNAIKMVGGEFITWKSNDLYSFESMLGTVITNSHSQFGRSVFSRPAVPESERNDIPGNDDVETEMPRSAGPNESAFKQDRNGGLSQNIGLGEEKNGGLLMEIARADSTCELHCMNLSPDDYDSSGSDSDPKESKDHDLQNSTEMLQNHIPEDVDIGDPFPSNGTCRRRIQKTRLLLDVIKECQMLEGAERSKENNETNQCEGNTVDNKSSSVTREMPPTRSQVPQRGDCRMKKKKALLPCKLCDSANIINSQGSLSSSSTKRDNRSELQDFEVCRNSESCAFEIPEEQRVHVQTFMDEIPMDIVELMAKNQHERQLFSSEEKNLAQSMNACSRKNASIMDITAVLQNDVSDLLPDDLSFSGTVQPTDARNKRLAAARKVKWSESNEMDFLPIILGTDGLSVRRKDLTCATIDFFGRLQFPVTCHNNKYIARESDRGKDLASRLSPTYVWPAEVYDTRLDIPIHSSLSLHKSPLDLQFTQETNFGSCCSDTADYPDSVANVKRNGTKINLGNFGIKALNPVNAPCPQNLEEVVSRTSSRGRLANPFLCADNESYHPEEYLYTNETISAMNLLRLMDKGVLLGTSGKSSTNRSHSYYHSKFSNDDQQKASVVPVSSLNNPLNSSLQPVTPECYDLNRPIGSMGKLRSQLSDTTPVGCSLQKEGSLDPLSSKAAFDYLVHSSCSVSSCMVHKMFPGYPNMKQNRREEIAKFDEYVELHPMDKKFQCGSGSLNLSRPSPKRVQSTTYPSIGIHDEKNEMASPIKSGCATEICTVNRNPAEISMHEDENGLMIQLESPKLTRCPPSDRPRKRRKAVKLTAVMANT